MTVDIQAAAEQEAADRWRREAGKPWRRVFVAGAVWAQARLTPTREQIAEVVAQFFGPDDSPDDVADAVLALMQD